MFQKKRFFLFLGGYAALRIFSYFFGPETPLQSQHWLNSLVTATTLFATSYWLIKKDARGWYVIALEIVLGGSGGFLSLFGLSLRTLLLMVSLTIFTTQKITSGKLLAMLKENAVVTILAGSLLGLALLQALHGYFSSHDARLVFADTIPYLFLFYYFPLREIIADKNFQTVIFNALAAAILGNGLLIFLTFTGFSSGLLQLQDSYYHWYRDVAGGKITELPYHFYRLVLNEHLLFVPVFLYFLNKIIRKELAHILLIFPALLLVILSVNLTRIYLVALAVGLLALFNRAEWRRWLVGSLATLLFFGAAFTGIHLLASRGESLGWEIFGIRLQSIVSPAIEDSSLSRMLLLPKIIEKIKAHPLIGEGLGATVSVYSPVFKVTITTPHFDWGYLEILAELGVVGFLVWVLIIALLIRAYTKNQLPRWQLTSFLALLAINLTSPALFHVLGVIWLTALLVLAVREGDDAWQQ